MAKDKLKKLVRLFFDFFVIGLFTFGGGWSIIAQLHRKYVEDRGVITAEELTDITSVGRSLPGIMVLNVSMLLGYRMLGLAGGVVCILGVAAPPFAVLLAVTSLYSFLDGSALFTAAMTGVRAAVVPIIAYAVAAMFKSSVRDLPCLLVLILSFVCYFFLGFGCVAVVVLGGVCGWLIVGYYERKGAA